MAVNFKYTTGQLRELQALPLERKVGITCARLTEFYTHFEGKVFVSFSGGKDSTVLLYIARKLFPEIKALYLDTGLEYPEIKEFVKTFENVDIRRPSISFKSVIEQEGYPVVSKEVSQYLREYREWLARQTEAQAKGEEIKPSCHMKYFNSLPPEDAKERKVPYYNTFRFEMCQRHAYLLDAPFKISEKCCKIMKKDISHQYQRETGNHPIIGTMAEESLLRKVTWLKNGCNAFDSREPKSTPMAFWTEQDVLQYIKAKNIPMAPIYGNIVEGKNGKLMTTGAHRTGCMFCLFGINHEKQPNRIQRLYFTHRKIYDYILNNLGFKDVMEFMGLPYKPVFDLFNQQEAK